MCGTKETYNNNNIENVQDLRKVPFRMYKCE